LSDIAVLTADEFETAYYLRMNAVDEPGVLADVTRLLGEQGISIEAILQKGQKGQKGSSGDDNLVPIVLLTQRVKEAKMNAALDGISQLSSVTGNIARIRVESLN